MVSALHGTKKHAHDFKTLSTLGVLILATIYSREPKLFFRGYYFLWIEEILIFCKYEFS